MFADSYFCFSSFFIAFSKLLVRILCFCSIHNLIFTSSVTFSPAERPRQPWLMSKLQKMPIGCLTPDKEGGLLRRRTQRWATLAPHTLYRRASVCDDGAEQRKVGSVVFLKVLFFLHWKWTVCLQRLGNTFFTLTSISMRPNLVEEFWTSWGDSAPSGSCRMFRWRQVFDLKKIIIKKYTAKFSLVILEFLMLSS